MRCGKSDLTIIIYKKEAHTKLQIIYKHIYIIILLQYALDISLTL
jgi:hypothetical protein